MQRAQQGLLLLSIFFPAPARASFQLPARYTNYKTLPNRIDIPLITKGTMPIVQAVAILPNKIFAVPAHGSEV